MQTQRVSQGLIAVTLAVCGFAALAAGVTAQPGCYGTPTPDFGDSGDTFVQEPCDTPTATSTRTAQPTTSFGGDVGSTQVWQYEPDDDGETYAWAAPQRPIISSPTASGALGPDGKTENETEVESTTSALQQKTDNLSGTASALEGDVGSREGTSSGGLDYIPSNPEDISDDFFDQLLFFFAVLKAIDPAQLGKNGELLRYSLLFFVFMLARRTRYLVRMALFSLVNLIIRVVKTIWELIPGN